MGYTHSGNISMGLLKQLWVLLERPHTSSRKSSSAIVGTAEVCRSRNIRDLYIMELKRRSAPPEVQENCGQEIQNECLSDINSGNPMGRQLSTSRYITYYNRPMETKYHTTRK
jgi:hypothetical protein